jgi:hypothetical protein
VVAKFPTDTQTFNAKVDLFTTVYANDVNALQDEVFALETSLGTGTLVSTYAGTFAATTSWGTLSLRLANIEAGLVGGVATNTSYVLNAGGSTILPPSGTIGLTTKAATGSTADLILTKDYLNASGFRVNSAGLPYVGTNAMLYVGSTEYTAITSGVTGSVPTARTLTTTAPLTGGGDLSANRTLAISDATTLAKGAVQLTDSTASTSTTTAATPNSVKGAYDLAAAAVPASRTVSTTSPLTGGGALSGNLTLAVNAGTTLVAGVLQLTDSTASTSTTTAATPNSVKTAYDLASGRVATSVTISTTSPLAGGGDLSTNRTLSIADATTSVKGAVQLTDSISSTSVTTAATPNSVKTVYDSIGNTLSPFLLSGM